jgi:cell division transport system permease protein
MNSIWTSGFLRSWKQQTAMQLATLSVLTGTFVVVAIFLLVHRNLNHILTNWGNSVRMSIFLRDSIGTEELNKVQKYLNDLQKFKEIKYISKDEAARQFLTQMASRSPDFLNDPDFGNPLPPSFETSLIDEIPNQARLSTMMELKEYIGRLDGVEEIYYGQGWVENYAALVRAFTLTSWVLVIVLLGGSLFVVGNSIRSIFFQRRDEIEILELVGATPEMIRIPYVVEGALMGLLAGLLAIFVVYVLFVVQTSVLESQMGLLNLGRYLGFLSIKDVFLLIFLGASFGSLGAYFCVRKICNGWSASQNQELNF